MLGKYGGPLTAILGATLFQLVPWALPGSLTVRAAWCWPADPPKCVIPAVTGGQCMKNGTAVTELQPGESCTPSCDAGLNVTGSCTSLVCPPSVPGSNNVCLDDQGGLWWPYCGFGDSCLRGVFTMDAAGYETSTQTFTFGHYSCADPAGPDAAQICGAVVDLVLPVSTNRDAEILDQGTIGIVSALFFVALMGMFFSLCCTGSCAKVWFQPGPKQWSPANVVGMVAVVIAVVAACSLPQTYKSTGVAAGFGTALTLVWSFFKLGAHDVLGMTREAAWRIHAVIGFLTLIIAIVHGVFAFIAVEMQVFTEWHFLLGFIGTILMLLGILPANLVHYDKFKMMHFLSFWGYLLCFIHMIGHAERFKTVAAITMAVLNGVALLLFFVQKIWVKATAGRANVQSVEVVEETGGQHLFLDMQVDKFSFKAGQWGHLQVPSISQVPHPFTLVPGEGPNSNVRIFMKINRKGFTAKLAEACKGGAAPAMKLEGPHGTPCVPAKGMERTVFVFGGVGITPGLSLAKAASEHSGQKVALYWSLRSLELLKRAAPLLEPHVELSQSCVQLNGSGMQEGGTDLPLQAKYDMKDLYQWLDSVGQTYAQQGVKNAMVFVCGPPGLADAAKAAAKKSAGGIHWHVHVEEFLFLPSMNMVSKRPQTAPVPSAKPVDVSMTS